MLLRSLIWLAYAAARVASVELPPLPKNYKSPGLPPGPPGPPPKYMVDHAGNTHHAAPDKGTWTKPITTQEERNQFLRSNNRTAVIQDRDLGLDVFGPQTEKRQDGTYWLQGIDHGKMPFAPDGYQFFRNVKDFGAVGDGQTDDTEAINRAASYYSESDDTERCGRDCGQTTTLGALVYFPPGTYMVSSPIIQYYYTQFVGDAVSRPIIKGTADFAGIALIDCDPYIPGGDGANWYINQNQFFRQIRNFQIDLTAMNRSNWDGDQEYVPTGIHWQVSQAASLQNIHFEMPVSDASGATTAVGIFMENGSGGFLSDLTFFGGNIGFRAGSQQYTARNLQFTSCLTAISMIWDWGFTWQNIYVLSCYVAVDCTSIGGVDEQGTGSITILDSHFNGVPYAVTLRNGGPWPNIVLDNLLVENSASVVLVSGGETIFEGSTGQIYFTSWAMGTRCTSKSGRCSYETSLLDPAPVKPAALLDGSGNYFARSKPLYTSYSPGSFSVATAAGIQNDGTGDQSGAINDLLQNAASAGRPVFFPAGVYLVEDTVFIPVGSIVIGEGWSQIMGTGSRFENERDMRPVVRVGNPGDSGVIEISDMLWTVKGATAGAILMEWNVHESSKGSAAMWDSHFRVGGAVGTDLRIDDCPKSTSEINRDCMAAAMLLHVTSTSSGYFENVWVWTADHDMDIPHDYMEDGNTTTSAQINIYTARGTLIESQGPTWLYGTGSEHHQLYQYQIQNARNVFLTHIQTETPYYQASPNALEPYSSGVWGGDPSFDDCSSEYCIEAWGLRVRSSSNVFLYTAGMYSFFQAYEQGCLDDESCQLKMAQTSYSEGLWFYNIFTKAAVQVISPEGGIPPLLQSDTDQIGFTTEISAWLVLALDGGDLGEDEGGSGSNIVYIDPLIFVTPSPTLQCFPPCTLVLPPSPVPDETVISFDPIETEIEIGGTTITEIIVTEITTTVISFFHETMTAFDTSFWFTLTSSLVPDPVTTTVNGITTTITLPAQTTAAGEDDEDTTFYSLPTTVVTSDETTYTYSMDQITRSSDSTTTTTSSIIRRDDDDDDDDDDDTTIPVYITTGGFYWSPVDPPRPTRHPIRFPDPPSPPCFAPFGIFSILCPPDKSQPTTLFTKGPPKPTCTAGCGTIGPGGDGGEEPSSTCLTATSTECHEVCRDGCSTVCNTYVGCSCPTATVTDYWVSCESTSCTTTRSQVVTGCYEEGEATTTGSYCPITSINTADDQGRDGASTNYLGLTTVTSSPLVVIGTSVYEVYSSQITRDGSWIPVPTIPASGTTITTTVDGDPATIYPEYIGPGYVVTDYDVIPSPSPDPVPPEEEDPDDPPPEDPPEDPEPQYRVSIYHSEQLASNQWIRFWEVYTAPVADLIDVCLSDQHIYIQNSFGVVNANPTLPDEDIGDFEIPGDVSGDGVDRSGCWYRNAGSGTPGTLECDGDFSAECIDIRGPENSLVCGTILFSVTYEGIVRCAW